MRNKNKITARKEETHAEVTDSQRRNAPLMSRLRSRPLWWTALSPQACRCSAAHRR